ncbi:MAG: hypothetical protein GEU71_18860, partial [Actinobacteria bacterium]|nr:hypothetical protein [Actinomycetota bacterium]
MDLPRFAWDSPRSPRFSGWSCDVAGLQRKGRAVMTQTQRDLGQILLEHGLVSKELFDAAAEQERLTGESVSQILVDGGHVTERQLSRARAVQQGVPFADLEKATPAKSIIATLPSDLVRKLGALPVKLQDDRLVVAMSDPRDDAALGELKSATGREIVSVAAHNPDLLGAIDRAYPEVSPRASGSGGAAAPSPTTAAAPTAASPGEEDSEGDWAPGREPAEIAAEPGEGKDPDLTEFLLAVIDGGASDLHLTAGIPPTVRLNGELVPLAGYRNLMPKDLQDLIYSMMSQKQRKQFEEELELDMSFALPGRGRFRVNIFRQR